jgi:hypothetical protein
MTDEPERVAELQVVARGRLAVARIRAREEGVVRVLERRPRGERAGGEVEERR